MRAQTVSREVGYGLVLAAVLFAAYLLVYRGAFTGSPDEYLLFDSTESFVNRGNLNITYLYHREFDPELFDLLEGREINYEVHQVTQRINAGKDPMRTGWYEPLYPIVAAPFFWIAQQTQSMGLIHSVYLTNIFVTVATALVLYIGGLRLGYGVKAAWSGALLFGLGSSAFPFVQYNLREPVTALMVLGCFLLAFELRARWRWWILAALGVAFAVALAGKVTVIFLLPGIVLLLVPSYHVIISNRRILGSAAGLIVIGFAVLWWLSSVEGSSDRLNISYIEMLKSRDRWNYALESLIGYQISPVRSIWLYSAAVLIGFPYAYREVRQGRGRFTLSLVAMIAVSCVGYGLTRANHWAGGTLAYGPRYLLPLVPLLFLWLMPALREIFETRLSRSRQMLIGAVVVLSIGMQIVGVLYHSTRDFDTAIGTERPPWEWEGFPPISASQPYLHLRYIYEGVAPDIAWVERAEPGWLIPLFAAGIFAFGVTFGKWIRLKGDVTMLAVGTVGIALGVFMAAAAWATVYSLRDDPVVNQMGKDIKVLFDDLNQEVQDDDIVLVSSRQFQEPLMNYFRGRALALKLQDPPGERHNEIDQPLLVSDDPADLLGPGTALTIDWAADNFDRLWLILPYGPFVDFALRPDEHYMVERYFPVKSIEPSQLARAVLFYLRPAPKGPPENILGARFDDGVALYGFDLPEGQTYSAGDIMPLSLTWQPYQVPSVDYHISVHLLTEGGISVTQRDSQPQGTFGFMTEWQPEQMYRDNHGFQIPANLPPGSYTLIVVVYDWNDGSRLGIIEPVQEDNMALLSSIQIR